MTARVQDQQAFLAALRHQALTPSTLLRTSSLLPLVRRELITDLPYNALPSLGLAYARVPQARVTHAYIDIASGLVQSGWSSDGQSILLPTTSDGIPALVRRLTHDPALGRMGAGVTVWDGSGTTGLAASVGTAPRRDGFVVAGVGSTPHAGRTRTVVVRQHVGPRLCRRRHTGAGADAASARAGAAGARRAHADRRPAGLRYAHRTVDGGAVMTYGSSARSLARVFSTRRSAIDGHAFAVQHPSRVRARPRPAPVSPVVS